MTRWEQFYREREREEALSQIKHRILHRKGRWVHLNHQHSNGNTLLVMQNPAHQGAEMAVDITNMLDDEQQYDDIADFAIKQLEQQGADRYRPTGAY